MADTPFSTLQTRALSTLFDDVEGHALQQSTVFVGTAGTCLAAASTRVGARAPRALEELTA
ncbi:MAG: hypothetical protein HYS27_23240 [Deltaproteobacteria bacterium]|nr:hypothetical protein [Deltaproteobacteria bacterium]